MAKGSKRIQRSPKQLSQLERLPEPKPPEPVPEPSQDPQRLTEPKPPEPEPSQDPQWLTEPKPEDQNGVNSAIIPASVHLQKATTQDTEQEEEEPPGDNVRHRTQRKRAQDTEQEEEEPSTDGNQNIIPSKNAFIFDGRHINDNFYTTISPSVETNVFRGKKLSELVIFISAKKLRENFTKITEFLNKCTNKDIKFHCNFIGLSETNLEGNGPPAPELPGYEFISEPSVRTIEGGGVGFYIREGINFTKRDDLTIPVAGCPTPCDSLFIEITPKTGKNIILGVVYIPSSIRKRESRTDKFLESFKNVLISINRETKKAFIMGDFNINLFLTNKTVTRFKRTVFNNSFHPLINQPTHVSKRTGVTKEHKTLIDNIFTNVNFHTTEKLEAGIIESDVSDHYPIYMSLALDDIEHFDW